MGPEPDVTQRRDDATDDEDIENPSDLVAGPAGDGAVTAGATPEAEAPTPALTAEAATGFDPHWCLFWGKFVRKSQLEIWIPYMRRSRYRFAIMASGDIIRPEDREKIAALPNVMLFEPHADALEWLRRSRSFRGVLYIGTQPENFQTVNRMRSKVHVYIGHGESGKGTSGFRTGSLYDSIFVAEYSVVRRFPRAIRRWVWSGVCATGTAIVEGVRKDPWTRPRPVKTILYAPTWETNHLRGDFSSLDIVTPILVALLPVLKERGIEVLMRPHPGTGWRLAAMKAALEELRAAGAVFDVPKAEAFERADVLISDISGVTAEFLLTEKPSVMPITAKLAEHDRDAAWLDVEYPWVYRWDVAGGDLLEILATIETRDPLRKRRASAARRKFRHHRSLDDAVRTWEIALDSVKWRRTPIPVRIPFEIKLLLERARPRRPPRRVSPPAE